MLGRFRILGLSTIVLLSACSGGGGSAVSTPAHPAAAAGPATAGTLTLVIPASGAATAAKTRTPQFVSPGASSVAVSVNGAADTFFDVSITSPNCTTVAGARNCTLAVTAPAGTPTILVALFDAPNGTGHMIAQGSGEPTVVLGTPFTVTVTMAPLVKFLNTGTVTYASGTSFTIGTAGSATVTLGADDAALQSIPPTATFAVPVLLTSSDPHVTITPASWTSPSQPISLAYDGSSNVAGTVTLTFTTGGVTLVSLPVTLSGTLSITEFPVPTAASEPVGLALGSDNAIWFVEQTGNNVARITTAGAITEFPIPTVNSAPASVAAGADNNLWFTEEQSSLTSKVGRITTAGVITEFSAGISAFSLPYNITSNPDGNLYFTEFSGNKIAQINPTTQLVTEFTIPTANSQPSYIVSGPDGALWFTQPGTNQIGRMTTAGVFSETSIPTASSSPSGIGVGPDGALWFLEKASSANKVGRITTAGVITGEFPIPTANSFPMTIATGADGNLWFTENGNAANKVTRMTTAGVFTEFVIPTVNSGPCSLALGFDGKIWFAENNTTGNKIGRI